MCFTPSRHHTRVLRAEPGRTRNTIVRNGERLRVGYKKVLRNGRTNVTKAGAPYSTKYPACTWVHGQEVGGASFRHFNPDQTATWIKDMEAGVYVYRTMPNILLSPEKYLIIRCAYRAADVLGADKNTVCVRAVLVLD